MEKNLCFILDEKKVYMDQCLLEDEIPIFFTCTDDDSNYYVALCTDMELMCYCVVEAEIMQLRDMLYGKISMRDIFTQQRFFWQVISEDGDAVNDRVAHKPIDQFSSEDLPLENAFFQLFSEELREYANLVNRKVLEGSFESFPMSTNEALKDINDGKEINAQVRCETMSAIAEIFSKAVIRECVVAVKTTKDIKIEYNREENCIPTKEKRSVEGGNIAGEKVVVKDLADKNLLLLAA